MLCTFLTGVLVDYIFLPPVQGWWLYVPVEEFYTFVGSAEAR